MEALKSTSECNWFNHAPSALEDDAASRPLSLLKGQQRCARRGLEYVVDALAAETRALEVPPGVDLARDLLALLCGDEAHGFLALFLDCDGVFAEILLEADEDDGDVGTEPVRFCYPLEGVSFGLLV
jgi:hypothetical protein